MEKGDLRAVGEKVILRPILISDVTERYLRWMNDEDVVRYTEARHHSFTLDGLREFVSDTLVRQDVVFLGIFEKETGLHIGNVKIGPISHIHRSASVGIIIGDKDFWGKGIAADVLTMVCGLSFGDLNIHKLTAGVIQGNDASLKAFLRTGFVIEGVRKKQNLFFGEWRDEILLGLLNEGRSDA